MSNVSEELIRIIDIVPVFLYHSVLVKEHVFPVCVLQRMVSQLSQRKKCTV